MNLHIMGGGAAKGLVEALQVPFETEHGVKFKTHFSAVGAIKDSFNSGEACDILILTRALIEDLTQEGSLVEDTSADLGTVQAGIAVPAAALLPRITTARDLTESLRTATSFFVPDLQRSTAGQHIARMLAALGLDKEIAENFREFPNGETAMQMLATHGRRGALGCTQMTEIRMTRGLRFVAPLPAEHALSTIYTAAISTRAGQSELARHFLNTLACEASLSLRTTCGFDA